MYVVFIIIVSIYTPITSGMRRNYLLKMSDLAVFGPPTEFGRITTFQEAFLLFYTDHNL